MKGVITDITTINAAESLWQPGPTDPWAIKMAARLADLLIWHPHTRFFLPVREIEEAGVLIPSLVSSLKAADSDLLMEERYVADLRIPIDDATLAASFASFLGWTRSQGKDHYLQWCKTHRQPWLRSGHMKRIMHGTVFELSHLKSLPGFDDLMALGLEDFEVRYSFDVAIRYFQAYGPRVPQNLGYYTHPIRSAVRWNILVEGPANPPEDVSNRIVPLTLGPHVYRLLKNSSWSMKDFCDFVARAREAAQRFGFQDTNPDHLPREKVQEFALELKLPPKVKGSTKTIGTATTAVGGLMAGANPSLAIASTLVTIAGLVWPGNLPSSFSKKWLRPVLEWDLASGPAGGQVERRS